MTPIEFFLDWLSRPETWSGPDAIAVRLGEHLLYSLIAIAIGALLAVPLGLYLGNRGRGEVFVLTLANTIRALPTLGLLTLVVLITGIGLIPPLLALVVLAFPPLLVNTFEGVRSLGPTVIDAARGMGYNRSRVIGLVQLPMAMPFIVLGLRLAAIQVISAATIAAYVGLGGLGRYIFDGLARRDFGAVLGGSILVAVLSIVGEVLLILVGRFLVSPGLQAQKVPRATGKGLFRTRKAAA